MQITGDARHRKIVFPTSRYELPFDSRQTDGRTDGRMRAGSVTIGHDRVDIAPNDFPSPLLEEPFVSAYDFTALWFYHLNSASSDLFRRFPPSLSLSFSRALSICLRLLFVPSHLSSPSRCRTRHYVTIVP